jgi:8-oxo-dGTP pyrophosphatase MutT (NUDIX family)/deoxyadenosine/deoxycytidine kinase
MLYKKIQQGVNPLFKAVGCICIFEGELLLLKRVLGKSYPSYWGVPSGKIKENESPVMAVVRELFEETGILLSNDNLNEIDTYHIVNNDMSFLYTLFVTNLKSPAKIKLNSKEHIKYGWFSPDNALRLELIPDLDECLAEVFPFLRETGKQMELFTGYSSLIINSTKHLETEVKKVLNIISYDKIKTTKDISISFGPPGAGKTSFFKELILQNPNQKLVSDNTWSKRTSNLNFYLRKAFEEEQRAFFFHFQMESLFARYSYTVQAPENSLVDESIYTTFAYSRALYRLNWIKKCEYEIFHRYYLMLFSLLPKPKEVIYLDCNVEVLKKRLNKRKRKHESYYTDDYVLALQYAFAEIANELEYKNKFKLIRLNSSDTSSKKLFEKYASVKRN